MGGAAPRPGGDDVSRAARGTERATDRLRERLDVLARIGELAEEGPGRVPDDLAGRLAGTVSQARARLGHGSSRTVVALAGATGSGKSSTFNALVGEEVARVGVRRPTTSTTQAAVFPVAERQMEGADGLLDWLGVTERYVADPARAADLAGLVLLDLPDHDSTSPAHREEVDRLVEVVDAFVWVVDPQKYADAALHHDYLQHFAGHGAVTTVVLNQIDTLADGGRRAALDDVARLLVADGLSGVRVIGTSSRTGEGMADLRREVAARVAERRALVARLDADVDWLADQLAAVVADRPVRTLDDGARRRLATAFAAAAGADAVAEAVGAAHRHRAGQVVGWPPTRWAARFRPDPLRRLGLDRVTRARAGARDAAPDTPAATVARTSLPAPSAVAEAAVRAAVRSVAEDASDGLPEPWRHRLSEMAASRRADIADGLDRAVGAARLPTDRPAWWSVASAVQWALAAVMVVGLVWLFTIGVVAWFQLPDLPTPRVGEAPVPTLLALGGALAGLLLAALGRLAARVGARHREATARRVLTAATAEAADALVLGPVDVELAALAEIQDLVRRLR
jgi:GTP-binding protein EngB required for normal cell division